MKNNMNKMQNNIKAQMAPTSWPLIVCSIYDMTITVINMEPLNVICSLLSPYNICRQRRNFSGNKTSTGKVAKYKPKR